MADAQPEPSEALASLKDSEITVSIKSLQEESLQISELTEMERNYVLEVITYAKQLIEPTGLSFHIKPSSISKSDNSLTDVVLTSQGYVCLMYNGGLVSSRSLESLQTETLVRILLEVLPELKTLFGEKREKLTARVGMLEKMAREFRKIAVVPSTVPPKKPAPQFQQNLVQPQIREKSHDKSQDAMRSALNGQ